MDPDHFIQSSTNETHPLLSIFSLKEYQNGLVIIYILLTLYMFLALSIVCDEFFVPALEVISEKLHLSPDVAGATFMAAGGSAPELFTNVAGTFFYHSDVGIGTIVGSAVFNILFVIGICSLASKDLLELTWWPLFRDVSFYSVSLILLMIFFGDAKIEVHEAVILFVWYILYCVFMKFNEKVEEKLKKPEIPPEDRRRSHLMSRKHTLPYLLVNHFEHLEHELSSEHTSQSPSPNNKQSQTERVASCKTPPSLERVGLDAIINAETGLTTDDETQDVEENIEDKDIEDKNIDDKNIDDEDPPEPIDLRWPDGTLQRLYYVLLFPLVFILWLTLPDLRNEKNVKWYPITFLGSIAWIGVFSFIMVGAAEVVGFTFQIPDAIMGLTVLAAGTSVPDLITSVIVARKGFGDMAVSSSVGSNLFDITVGLPVPWILFCLINNATYPVDNKGMMCSVATLFGMMIAVVSSIAIFRWKMYKALGIVMLILYIGFLVVAVLLENDIVLCPFSS